MLFVNGGRVVMLHQTEFLEHLLSPQDNRAKSRGALDSQTSKITVAYTVVSMSIRQFGGLDASCPDLRRRGSALSPLKAGLE